MFFDENGINSESAFSSLCIWRSPSKAQVKNVLGFKNGGENVVVNAFKKINNTDIFVNLSVYNITITANNVWQSSSLINNISGSVVEFNEGDELYIKIISSTKPPIQVSIQVDMEQ